MSKLIVEVVSIDNLEVLPNADKLVMATVKGWNCLVSKGEYTVGQPVIFVPPDAVVPPALAEELKLEFLKTDGRVKTLKLRGYLSQGLILPLSVLKGYTVRIGDDVAKVLGITKFEVPLKVSGNVVRDSFNFLLKKYLAREITLRRFVVKLVAMLYDRYLKPRKNTNPNFKEYTDIQNIKHYPVVFTEGEEVIITEKLHGTNFRAGTLPKRPNVFQRLFNVTPGYEFVYGSHTVQKTPTSGKGFYGEDVYGRIAQTYNLKNIIPDGYTVYGEIFGENKPGAAIQKGFGYGISGLELAVFDVKRNGKYLDWAEMVQFCHDRELPMVPVLYQGPYSADILKKYTDGNTTFRLCNGAEPVKQIREGAVVKPITEQYSNQAGRKVLKSVSADYLLLQHKTKADETTDFAH